jgi:hypothetical protein
MRLNVLFWNVQRKDLTAQIVNLAKSRTIDIFVLAENPVSSVRLILALNTDRADYFPNHPLSNCDKITIITRFSYEFIQPRQESNRLTIREVELPGEKPFLLTAVHLVDKGSFSPESQTQAASEMASDIARAEVDYRNNRNIVLGDFNMNPFETGMVMANGFHGVMSGEIARQGTRTVQEREYPYFYNPTWGLFGDLNETAPGTYYYRKAEHVCYEWNLFDQVLIRPTLIDNFVKGSLEIVQTDGVTSLLTKNNRPNQKDYSDHLPLFFTLNFD